VVKKILLAVDKLPLVRSVLPDKDLQRRKEQGKEREKAGGGEETESRKW